MRLKYGAVALLMAALSLCLLFSRDVSGKRLRPRHPGYPSTCKVDAFLEAARTMPPERRLPEARKLIDDILGSEVDEDDDRDPIWVWQYFIERWGALFEELGESDIATAIDETRTDGGYSITKCGFYTRTAGLPSFVAHYKSRDLGPLLRCGEIRELRDPLAVTRAARTGPPARPKITACEVSRELSRLRGLAPGARTAAVASLISKVEQEKSPDPVGQTYLATRLTSVLQNGDEAVFAALDAAAERKMTSSLCWLYHEAAWSKGFGPRYRRPDRRKLIRPCEKDERFREQFERAFAR